MNGVDQFPLFIQQIQHRRRQERGAVELFMARLGMVGESVMSGGVADPSHANNGNRRVSKEEKTPDGEEYPH